MKKSATTIEQQIEILRSRGMIISDDEKAKEVLSDIGYYRLCFYTFPFEKSYPNLNNRTHEFIDGTKFEDIVALYYFDFDLRKILVPYLTRIEVAFRTAMTYYLSNKYLSDPRWFVNKSVVNPDYVRTFRREVYKELLRTCPTLQRHHKKYPNDRYAPAWKTIEMMMFGKVVYLYKDLIWNDDQRLISKRFNINQASTFLSYIDTTRMVRNACAHGLVLFDYRLPMAISKGPIGALVGEERHNLSGMLKVITYLLGQVSENRVIDMQHEIEQAKQILQEKSLFAYKKMQKIAGF